MAQDEDRLPAGLWIEAHLRELDARAVPAFIVRRGNYASGLILLKINGLKGRVRLLTQERSLESGKLEWTAALAQETVDEPDADQYIQRAAARDPDIWAVEVEDPEMKNPFAGN